MLIGLWYLLTFDCKIGGRLLTEAVAFKFGCAPQGMLTQLEVTMCIAFQSHASPEFMTQAVACQCSDHWDFR